MNNLFEVVQDLTIAHDASMGLPVHNETQDPEQASKCYKDPHFTGFKCDACDCKEWN